MNSEMIKLLAKYISFKSVAGVNEIKKECLDWLEAEFLSKTKHRIHRGDIDSTPYLYMEHTDPELIWFAHADVVPAVVLQFNIHISILYINKWLTQAIIYGGPDQI